MSLDVYLDMEGAATLDLEDRIYVREDGRNMRITRKEWDRRYPDREPVTLSGGVNEGRVYHGNITHNLNKMAREAGIYEHLWRPDELGIIKAAELVIPLAEGLARLVVEPERFKALNPPNGWGDYEGLCAFVAEYLQACRAWPEAVVSVWR